jgi:hypothetical protein
MSCEFYVSATDLRDYAKALGWVVDQKAVRDRLYVLTNPRFARRQLVFPIEATAPDYCESVRSVAEKLAETEQKPLQSILNSLDAVRDDTLRFGITFDRNSTSALPLLFVASIVEGAQQLLRAAACTVVNPQRHHPRLNRTEAQLLVDKSEFRHTELGSFVLRVSCPVDALNAQGELLGDERSAPFVRRAMVTVARSVERLVSSVEADTLDTLVQDTKDETEPIISSNLCDALIRFRDEGLNNALEVSVSWAASKPFHGTLSVIRPIRIQPDYFPRIEEVGRALRSAETHREDTFVGTVESLNGEIGSDGRRAGEVILALLMKDERELIRARIDLTADQYEVADRAHMTYGAYVLVAGKLHPGRQPRSLTEIRRFEMTNLNSSIL